MRTVVLLFDIDGTLLLTGGAGQRAMQAAFAHVEGRADACTHFSFAGMTDRAILREGLRAIGREPRAAAIDAVLEAYLVRLPDEVARARDFRILPGVTALVASLNGEQGVAIGLGTGNVRRGAMTKLMRGDLHGAFAFGGFGCDAEDRAEILRAGATRGAEALRTPLEACDVVVIGDTPRDVDAALAIGARCVAVGTGGVDPAALLDRGASHAFATLADDGVRDAILPR